jgi:2-polyprenyl-6-methoxyphenol hydroxylase-like FAD-dependent oxidoreductase
VARAGGTPRRREIALRLPFEGASRDAGDVLLAGTGTRVRYLVGADGAHSRVARAFGLSRNRAFLLGVEAEYEGVGGIDSDRLHCVVADLPLPNWLFNAMIGSSALRLVASSIYFHRRGGAASSEAMASAEDDLRRPAE